MLTFLLWGKYILFFNNITKIYEYYLYLIIGLLLTIISPLIILIDILFLPLEFLLLS